MIDEKLRNKKLQFVCVYVCIRCRSWNTITASLKDLMEPFQLVFNASIEERSDDYIALDSIELNHCYNLSSA